MSDMKQVNLKLIQFGMTFGVMSPPCRRRIIGVIQALPVANVDSNCWRRKSKRPKCPGVWAMRVQSQVKVVECEAFQ